MSQRARNRIPVPQPLPHKISDTNRLMWERYFNPMQSAAAQLNAAITNVENILGAIILEREGFSPDTHQFNAGNGTIVPRLQQGGANGAVD